MTIERLETVGDTEEFGRRLADGLNAGDLVVLDGPLGAGKTALTRGIAAGLEVQGRVSSPTFIIAREHRAGSRGIPLVHVDAYRLLDAEDPMEEIESLDLATDLSAAVVVVEWGSGLVEQLADRFLLVELRRAPESDVREATWRWVER